MRDFCQGAELIPVSSFEIIVRKVVRRDVIIHFDRQEQWEVIVISEVRPQKNLERVTAKQ